MADLNRGYIKLWRKVDRNPVWTQLKPAVYKVFTGCLLRANWKEMKIYNGSQQMTVPRGAFLTSLQDLATYCNVTRDQARGAIDHLEGMDFISTHRIRTGGARLGLLVTLINYDRYQVQSDDTNTVHARSGPSTPPQKNTVGDFGKEVLVSSLEETKKHTPPRAPADPDYDWLTGWERVVAVCQRPPVAPQIIKAKMARDLFFSDCETPEREAEILDAIERLKASGMVERGYVPSLENMFRDGSLSATSTFAPPAENESDRERRKVRAL